MKEEIVSVQISEIDCQRAAAAILHGARENWDDVAQIVEDLPAGRQPIIGLVVAMTTIIDATLRSTLSEGDRDAALEGISQRALEWASREAERG